MTSLVSFVNQFLSLLTLLSQIVIAAYVVLFLFYKNKRKIPFLPFFARHALLLSFIVALTATLGSLFFSEIVKFEPCKLCWYQRIFMYPQVLLLGLALYKKTEEILDYSIALSLLGGSVALYHYLLQIGIIPAETFKCSTVGYSVSCTEKFATSFGYITLPLMAFTAFLTIALLLGLKKIWRKI